MRHLFIPLCALVLTATNVAFATEPLFTPKQLSDLKSTRHPIIVPKYLPDGFRIKKVAVDRKHPEVSSYSIWFVGPGNSCFVIEMGTEVGDMIVENAKGKSVRPSSVIHNPTLGDTGFWNTREYLGTDWFPSYHNAAYMIRGDWDRNEFSRDKSFDNCKRMKATEFMKVAQSLDVLR